MADAGWRLPTEKMGVVAGTRPVRKAPVPHSNVDISRHSDLGHARLQRYWSALQESMLQGESHVTAFKALGAVRVTYTAPACLHTLLQASTSCVVAKEAQQQSSQEAEHAGRAADGKMEQAWPRQEQRALCQACQEAMADGRLAEVVRLLQRLQLGQQIVERDLAWAFDGGAVSKIAPLRTLPTPC